MSDKNAFVVKWSIENVKSWFQERDDALYSPQFLAKPMANTRWKLRLSRNRYLEETYICLTLQRDIDNDGPDLVILNCELSFLACDGSTIISKDRAIKYSTKTVSHELNVKEIEIFEERKEEYLSEGVMTVCCKLRGRNSMLSMVSKGEECLIRSVIGTKCESLESTVDDFRSKNIKSDVIVKFLSPSSDISLIYFDMQISHDRIELKRIKVDCKCLNMLSCTLFVINAAGEKTKIFNNDNLSTLLNSNKECGTTAFYNLYNIKMLNMLQKNSLKMRLEISYSPGVQSEHMEYKLKNSEKLLIVDQVIKDLSTGPSENINSNPGDLQTSEQEAKQGDTENERFECQDFYFDASKSGNMLQTTLRQDLSSLFNDRLFCDTKLITDTETFPVHRNVLSARSPVFKKMFTTDMKEKAGEGINITDISADIIYKMLQFLYTDCTGVLNMQSAKDLYIASDKYDIASLKDRCSSYMKKNLCPANVCDVLVLTDMHQDKDLESAAQDYVLSDDEEVFYSDEWKLFMKNYSALAAYLMYLKCTKK